MKDQTTINMEKRIAENKKRIEQLNSDYKSASLWKRSLHAFGADPGRSFG